MINLILILLSGMLGEPKSGIVTTTICSTYSDSCMVRVKLDNLNRDTIVILSKKFLSKIIR